MENAESSLCRCIVSRSKKIKGIGRVKAYWFVYEETDNKGKQISVIRIRAKRKPGPNTIPGSGAWVLQQFVPVVVNTGLFTETHYRWEMPCFPEITWGRLKKMRLARRVENDNQ